MDEPVVRTIEDIWPLQAELNAKIGIDTRALGRRLAEEESRGALPATLPYFDAVKSVNSAAYIVAAFASGDFAKLRHAAGDFLHEPYRLPGIPGARAAIDAGTAAGASPSSTRIPPVRWT